MNCPNCSTKHIQACTITHQDELGLIQEPFCYCSSCDEDITEGVVDEWVIRHTEGADSNAHQGNRKI